MAPTKRAMESEDSMAFVCSNKSRQCIYLNGIYAMGLPQLAMGFHLKYSEKSKYWGVLL